MPSFDYKCSSCGHDYEVFVKTLTAKRDTTCPNCQSKDAVRVFSAPMISTTQSSGSDIDYSGATCSSPTCASGMCGI